MAEGSVQHESLALPGYWRITSFGTLTENPLLHTRDDLRIRTYLAPLNVLANSSPEKAATVKTLRSMLLPVGELPRLHLNAILHNGQFVADKIHHLHFEQHYSRALDCSRDNIRVLERYALDEFGNYIIPVRNGWREQLSDPEMHGLFIALGSPHDPYATIIPAIEIFRFFYATSDVVAKALLRDDFLDPETNLWNPEKTAIQPDGRALIWLRKKMLDADARFLARFAFDNYALHQAQQIFLYAAALGKSHGARMLRALPPFEDTVTTKFLGCPLQGEHGTRVLVTRLLQCHWKPPFTELKWDRDNDGRYDPYNRSERPPSEWSPNLSVPKDENSEPDTLATSAPSTPCIPSRLKESEITERFPELEAVPADKLPQENAETRADHRNWQPVMQEAYKGSVIDGQSSRDLIGKTIIEGLEKKPEPKPEQTNAVDVNVGQADYLVIVELLKAIQNFSLADVQFLEVLKSVKLFQGIPFNVYPEELDGKKKAWLYIDKDKKCRRMVLLAKITWGERKRYIIELQQRKPKESSTLVIWQGSEYTIPAAFLEKLVMDCAKAGCARLDSTEILRLNWDRLHHTTKVADKESANHFLERIFSAGMDSDKLNYRYR